MNIQKRIEEKANEGEYREGESCSFYMNEIDAFQEGAHFGFALAVEMLRSEEAMNVQEVNAARLVTCKQWADWLETEMKEQGED